MPLHPTPRTIKTVTAIACVGLIATSVVPVAAAAPEVSTAAAPQPILPGKKTLPDPWDNSGHPTIAFAGGAGSKISQDKDTSIRLVIKGVHSGVEATAGGGGKTLTRDQIAAAYRDLAGYRKGAVTGRLKSGESINLPVNFSPNLKRFKGGFAVSAHLRGGDLPNRVKQEFPQLSGYNEKPVAGKFRYLGIVATEGTARTWRFGSASRAGTLRSASDGDVAVRLNRAPSRGLGIQRVRDAASLPWSYLQGQWRDIQDKGADPSLIVQGLGRKNTVRSVVITPDRLRAGKTLRFDGALRGGVTAKARKNLRSMRGISVTLTSSNAGHEKSYIVITGDSISSGESGRYTGDFEGAGWFDFTSVPYIDLDKFCQVSDLACTSSKTEYEEEGRPIAFPESVDYNQNLTKVYDKGTEGTGECHRSKVAPGSWLTRYYAAQGEKVETINLACSGATTKAMTETYNGQEPQAQELRETASFLSVPIVTNTMGANDIGFSSVATGCFMAVASPFMSGDSGPSTTPLFKDTSAAWQKEPVTSGFNSAAKFGLAVKEEQQLEVLQADVAEVKVVDAKGYPELIDVKQPERNEAGDKLNALITINDFDKAGIPERISKVDNLRLSFRRDDGNELFFARFQANRGKAAGFSLDTIGTALNPILDAPWNPWFGYTKKYRQNEWKVSKKPYCSTDKNLGGAAEDAIDKLPGKYEDAMQALLDAAPGATIVAHNYPNLVPHSSQSNLPHEQWLADDGPLVQLGGIIYGTSLPAKPDMSGSFQSQYQNYDRWGRYFVGSVSGIMTYGQFTYPLFATLNLLYSKDLNWAAWKMIPELDKAVYNTAKSMGKRVIAVDQREVLNGREYMTPYKGTPATDDYGYLFRYGNEYVEEDDFFGGLTGGFVQTNTKDILAGQPHMGMIDPKWDTGFGGQTVRYDSTQLRSSFVTSPLAGLPMQIPFLCPAGVTLNDDRLGDGTCLGAMNEPLHPNWRGQAAQGQCLVAVVTGMLEGNACVRSVGNNEAQLPRANGQPAPVLPDYPELDLPAPVVVSYLRNVTATDQLCVNPKPREDYDLEQATPERPFTPCTSTLAADPTWASVWDSTITGQRAWK